MNGLVFSIVLFTLGFSLIAAEPAPTTDKPTPTAGKMDSCRAAQDAARESIKAIKAIKAIEDAKTSGDPAKL